VKVKYLMGPHLKRRWALWQWMDIPSAHNANAVYLRRLRVVQTPWFSVLIHWINEPDAGRHPHDHPWWFASWVVRGGYVEEMWPHYGHYRDNISMSRLWPRRSWHTMSFWAAHRITEVLPGTITVIFTGRRRRKFRFWTPDGRIPYDKMVPAEVDDVE
jgi:hypothetical protein